MSPAEKLASLDRETRARLIRRLSIKSAYGLRWDWPFWARPSQLPPADDKWLFWLMMAGRGSGKLLDVDTPIPTPTGWTTMGALRLGDRVFDEAGNPCNVIWVSNTQIEPTYRLTFSDGAVLVAGASHQWITWTHRDRKAFLRSTHERDRRRFPKNWPAWRARRRFNRVDPEAVALGLALLADGETGKAAARQARIAWVSLRRYIGTGFCLEDELTSAIDAPGPRIKTTEAIKETLVYNRRGDANHCIPLCGALQLPEIDLPIDPYVLGLWLGDGSQKAGELTTADDELYEYVAAAGYAVGEPRRVGQRTPIRSIGTAPQKRDPRTGRMTANDSLASALWALGLRHRKFVPAPYLRAGTAQRLALLQGLMDSDGHIDRKHECEFVSTSAELAAGAQELALSLGIRATLNLGRAKLYGRDTGPKYRVLFTTETPVFRLRRKAEKLPIGRGQQLRQNHRMIVAVDEIAAVPMRCIAVDSPNRMYLAGRAMIPTHNTRSGAEWVRQIKQRVSLIALVGATLEDVRDIMIEGPAGLLATAPPGDFPQYEPAKRRLVWRNGATAYIYSAQRPDRLRGPQHEAAWVDELASFAYPDDTWSNLQFGLRLGRQPRTLVTTTPRPIKLIRDLLKDPLTRLSRTSSYANRAHLAPAFVNQIIKRYEGTRLGRQEIYAEVLDDVPGALWNHAGIERDRWPFDARLPQFKRIVVAIDPAMSSGEDADETGIIVAACDWNGHGYVLADVSGHYQPVEWARAAIAQYHHPERKADRIVAEVNAGGEMVEHTIRMVDEMVPFTAVHASRGKAVRAEPVSALYEQHRIHHVGSFPQLEDEMCSVTVDFDRDTAGFSPDRVDALVWAFSDLLVEPEPPPVVITREAVAAAAVPAPRRRRW